MDILAIAPGIISIFYILNFFFLVFLLFIYSAVHSALPAQVEGPCRGEPWRLGEVHYRV